MPSPACCCVLAGHCEKALDCTHTHFLAAPTCALWPAGIIGQTFDHDDKMVIGMLDDYNVPSDVIVTRAMAEGFIEGQAADYEVDLPFSTDFKFSRFGRTGRVPPRNVSALSGAIIPAKKGAAPHAAGALNDKADA